MKRRRAAHVWLRVEGLAVAILGTVLFAQVDSRWFLYVVGLLAPDLSMVGYIFGARIGAWVYNAAHVYVGPLLLLLVTGHLVEWQLLDWPDAQPIAFIWAAHIGLDRALGFGLKHRSGFRFTHLGEIGSDNL